MKFYLLAFLYLFVFFGSLYGLFVSELNIGLGAGPEFSIVLRGWVKNLLCSGGLLLVAGISAYPIISAVSKALGNGGE